MRIAILVIFSACCAFGQGTRFNRQCSSTITTNCVPVSDANGNVTIGTTVQSYTDQSSVYPHVPGSGTIRWQSGSPSCVLTPGACAGIRYSELSHYEYGTQWRTWGKNSRAIEMWLGDEAGTYPQLSIRGNGNDHGAAVEVRNHADLAGLTMSYASDAQPGLILADDLGTVLTNETLLLRNNAPTGGLRIQTMASSFLGDRLLIDPTHYSAWLSNNDLWFHAEGTRNGFFGQKAGNTTLSGADNAGLGFNALLSLTSGSTNTAVGSGALVSTTTGANNVAVGYNAAASGVGANGNIAIGNIAMYLNGAGGFNVAIGNQALTNMNGASVDVAVGASALANVSSGASNTALGASTGATLTTGANNTLLGNSADVSAAAASYRTVIGAGASGTADNSITLGRTTTDAVYIPAIKSTTGTRYVCVDTAGKLVSQTTACSGT